MWPSVWAALVCLAAVAGSTAAIAIKQNPLFEDKGLVQGLEVAEKGGAANRLAETFLKGILDRYDPYHVRDANFSLDLPEVTASVFTSGVVITGAKGVKLRHLLLTDLADGKATVNLTLPSISVEGNYNMTGHLSLSGIPLSLDGAGPLTAGFKDLHLQTSIGLGITYIGEMTLDDFDLDWNMSDIWLQLKGLFGGQALGQVINELLKDALPRLVLKVYHKPLTNRIIAAVKEQGDAIIRSLHRDHGTPPANLLQGEAVVGDKPQIVLVQEDIDEPDSDKDFLDDLSELEAYEYSSEENTEDGTEEDTEDTVDTADDTEDTDEKYSEQQEHLIATEYNEQLELLAEVRRLADALGATFTTATKLFPAGTLDDDSS